MLKIFELIGRYFMLMGKVFSRPEKAAIYRRRIIFEMESLGVMSPKGVRSKGCCTAV